MEQILAEKISKELKIDITQVVREYWEIVFLKELLESPYGKYLVFKGGTALRLVYGSPRFSEDLDFSLSKDALKGGLSSLVEKIVSPYPEAIVTDVAEKFYTYLSEIKITQGYLPVPFRIKIEISRRAERDYAFELRLVASATSPLQVLGNVATLNQLYRDKLACIEDRIAPKDLFDLWFLCQKMKMPYAPPRTVVTKKVLIQELRKYLPTNYWNVIEELL